jgi:AcrR family transcriptional regulator
LSIAKRPARPYRMKRRAEAIEETRNQIIWATMQLHAEKGVAATSQADVAARARVAPATVYRHFPTMGALVHACGRLTWDAVDPPTLEDASRLYDGLESTHDRLVRFVDEVSAFYARAWASLEGARRERHRVPELDEELRGVEAGIEELALRALDIDATEAAPNLQLVLALTDFGVWKSLRDHGISEAAAPKLMTALMACALPQPG